MAQQTGAIYHQGILYSGGSGTNVTPNPQGEATDTLNTVEIDGTVYDIEGGGGSNLILNAQKYSLEEQVVGIWTDGKPLYQKTINCGLLLQDTSWHYVPHNISNIDNVVSINNIGLDTTKIEFQTIPVMRPSQTNGVVAYVNGDNIQIMNNWVAGNKFILYTTLQYTKTTDLAGSGGYQAYGFSPIIYSDTEREVGVWRDNKPLYQKTIHLSALPSTANTIVNYQHNISDIDTICSWDGLVRWSSGTVRFMPNAQFADSSLNTRGSFDVEISKTEIRVWVGADRSSMNGDFTIWYTKTTDVAGSGEYNTLAIPNVHYSTDEQVIGTWIDGKPLYRKVIEFTGGNTITAGNVDSVVLNEDTSLLNVKRWIKTTCVTYDYGSSITTDVFGTLSVKSIHGTQAQIYNAKITDNILLPSTGNYIIAEYTKTTD